MTLIARASHALDVFYGRCEIASSAKHLMKLLVGNAMSSGQFSQTHTLRAVLRPYGFALIASLLSWGSPANVAGLVMPVHIDTVKRMSLGRSSANVPKEGRKVVAPLLAHRNTTPTVGRVLRVGGVEAASFGLIPRTPFWSEPTPRGRSMRQAFRTADVPTQTAATLGNPARQVVRRLHNHGAAVTPTRPELTTSGTTLARQRNYEKPTETLSDAIRRTHAHRTEGYQNGWAYGVR